MEDKMSLVDETPIGSRRSPISFKGKVCIELRGPDGEVKDTRKMSNVVVDLGEQYIVDVWHAHETSTPIVTRMIAMKLGTDNTPANDVDTDLGSYISGSSKLLTSITQTTPWTLRWITTWISGSLANIEEIGIFDNDTDATGGLMLARAIVSPPITATMPPDTITATWDIFLG